MQDETVPLPLPSTDERDDSERAVKFIAELQALAEQMKRYSGTKTLLEQLLEDRNGDVNPLTDH